MSELTAADRRLLQRSAQSVRRWTTERDRRIRAARAAGLSLRAIAKEVGLTHSAIAKIVAK